MTTGNVSDLPAGTKCTVHMNLHRQRKGLSDCWSVTVGGKVFGYAERVTLENAEPVYREWNWKEIKKKGHRQVYALIRGIIAAPGVHASGREIHCNPHRYHDFTHTDGTSYTGSAVAEFNPGQSYFTI